MDKENRIFYHQRILHILTHIPSIMMSSWWSTSLDFARLNPTLLSSHFQYITERWEKLKRLKIFRGMLNILNNYVSALRFSSRFGRRSSQSIIMCQPCVLVPDLVGDLLNQ